MKLFEDWTRDECRAAIKKIEVNLARGISSVSQPTQGGITYRTVEEALSVLSHLRARIDRIDGALNRTGFAGDPNS